MSADGQGELEPEVPRKNVVGLFCGAAFHEVVFARVSGCDVVRLYDWELRMRKLACLFFPERGVVKEMDIRAENIGALEADIGLAVPAAADPSPYTPDVGLGIANRDRTYDYDLHKSAARRA